MRLRHRLQLSKIVLYLLISWLKMSAVKMRPLDYSKYSSAGTIDFISEILEILTGLAFAG
jgi:hypothetical protein